jgi:hypothetical protein
VNNWWVHTKMAAITLIISCLKRSKTHWRDLGSYIFQVYTKVLDKVAKGPITWTTFNPGVELSPVYRVEISALSVIQNSIKIKRATTWQNFQPRAEIIMTYFSPGSVSFVLSGEYIQYSPLINFRLIITSNIHMQLIIPSNIPLQCLCSTKNEKKTTSRRQFGIENYFYSESLTQPRNGEKWVRYFEAPRGYVFIHLGAARLGE